MFQNYTDIVENLTEIGQIESFSTKKIEWTWILMSKTTVFTIIICLIIIGNSLVLLAVIFNQNLRSPTHTFIGNLAIADLLVGILVLPCNATSQITLKWYFGPTYCTLWTCIHLWLCSTSILSICAICFDRYIGVSRPLEHFRLMHGKVIKQIIASVWILAFCLGAIPVFVWPEPPSDDYYVCKINRRFGLVMVVSVGIFYIPLTLMIFFYGKIFSVAMRRVRSIQNGLKVGSHRNSNLRIHIGGSGSNLNLNGRKGGGDLSSSSTSTENLLSMNLTRQTNAAKKLAVVVGAFIFCYFPFFTVFTIKSLNPDAISNDIFDIFGWLRYFNCALNPFIYAAMLPAFRSAFYKIISCRTLRQHESIISSNFSK